MGSKTIAYGAICTALTVLSLYLSAVIPTGSHGFLFISSMVGAVLLANRAYGVALLAYIASSILAFLILPDKLPALFFASILGHYGIFRAFLGERRPDRKITNMIIRILYIDVFAALALYLSSILFAYDITNALSFALPIYAVIAALQLMFMLYDVLYAFCYAYYVQRIHTRISQ